MAACHRTCNTARHIPSAHSHRHGALRLTCLTCRVEPLKPNEPLLPAAGETLQHAPLAAFEKEQDNAPWLMRSSTAASTARSTSGTCTALSNHSMMPCAQCSMLMHGCRQAQLGCIHMLNAQCRLLLHAHSDCKHRAMPKRSHSVSRAIGYSGSWKRTRFAGGRNSSGHLALYLREKSRYAGVLQNSFQVVDARNSSSLSTFFTKR